MLFGTINGVIGVIASLPQAQYQLLESLQVSPRHHMQKLLKTN